MAQSDSEKRRVGYRNPPEGTRFKPGLSGNPKGRPQKVPTFAEDVQHELNQPHRINATKTVTTQRAIVIALVAQALDGDTRAVAVLMRFVPKQEEHEEEPQQVALSPAQHELLRELVTEEISSQTRKQSDINDKTQGDNHEIDQQTDEKD